MMIAKESEIASHAMKRSASSRREIRSSIGIPYQIGCFSVICLRVEGHMSTFMKNPGNVHVYVPREDTGRDLGSGYQHNQAHCTAAETGGKSCTDQDCPRDSHP